MSVVVEVILFLLLFAFLSLALALFSRRLFRIEQIVSRFRMDAVVGEFQTVNDHIDYCDKAHAEIVGKTHESILAEISSLQTLSKDMAGQIDDILSSVSQMEGKSRALIEDALKMAGFSFDDAVVKAQFDSKDGTLGSSPGAGKIRRRKPRVEYLPAASGEAAPVKAPDDEEDDD